MWIAVVEYIDCIDGEKKTTESSWMSDEDVKAGDVVVVWSQDKFTVVSRKAVVRDIKTVPINETGNLFHSYITYPQKSWDKTLAD